MTLELSPMTRERMHALYRHFTFDPDTFADMSLYERYRDYRYDAGKVDALFDKRSGEANGVAFAITLDGAVIGEVALRHIDANRRECTLSIHLQNDLVKDRGYGTQAERLAIDYAFDRLGMERVLADAVQKNARSRHVLEKLGFRYLYEKDGFAYYSLEKKDWQS